MKRFESRLVWGLIAFFFFSGAAGLAYQVVWSKAFGAGIGHEYPATLAVVTAFMSGMALGGFIFERLPNRWQSSRFSYGSLELLLALWGAITAFSIPGFNGALLRALGEAPSTARHWIVVFAGVFLVLLPATAAMGATVPAMQRLVSALTGQRCTGLIYSANTAGAMLGALFSAFWAIRLLGIRGAILGAAALNALCAAGAFVLVRRSRDLSVPSQTSHPNAALSTRLVLTGFLGIGFEVAIIRGLSHVLENTVYTFAVVLAVYLLGTAVGSAIYQRVGDKISARGLFVALALSCLLSAIALRWTPSLYAHLRSMTGDTLSGVATAEFTVALCVISLPTVCMGATFAQLAELSLQCCRSLGWAVWRNSLGSACAPAVFGLLVLPVVGLKMAFAAIALGYAVLAGRWALWAVPAAAGLALFATSTENLVTHPGQSIVFLRDGVMASVSVLENTNRARVLKVNNRFQMGGTAARIAEERHADIPLLLHPEPRRALFIGLGTGITFATAAKYPGLIADGVELVPEVVEALPYFQEDPGVIQNPRLRIHRADGRRYVLTTTNRYDVIVGDLFHPAQDGAGFLFTREHFAAVRDRLAENGLFCQWLPLYQMDLRTVQIVANTFVSVFPGSEMWLLRFNVDTPAIGLIGWKNGIALQTDLVEKKLNEGEALPQHLRTVALGDTLRLLGCRMGKLKESGSGERNTDQHPIIMFEAPSLTFQQRDDPAERLLYLLKEFAPQDAASEVQGANDTFRHRLKQFVLARNLYLAALVEESSGDLSKAINLYVETAQLSIDFTMGYAQALGIATTMARRNPAGAEAILNRLIEARPERPVARQLLERLRSEQNH